jgi:hypothetical protein
MLELLNQLDGFDARADVKVILATNRIESLDPALLRPGRIDRKIEFPLPDIKTKRRIFQVIILLLRNLVVVQRVWKRILVVLYLYLWWMVCGVDSCMQHFTVQLMSFSHSCVLDCSVMLCSFVFQAALVRTAIETG